MALEKPDERVAADSIEYPVQQPVTGRGTAMDGLGGLLPQVTHELRTPLNAILNYADLLRHELTDRGLEGLHGDLDRIERAGRHLLMLVDNLLSLSKLEAGRVDVHAEPFVIHEILSQVGDIIRPLASRNGNQLQIDCPRSLGAMNSDPLKLRQALINLAGNAAKFTRDGMVTITVQERIQADQSHIVFTIADTGIGMADEALERIFQPFVQLPSDLMRQAGGTGLGLAITREFAHLLGGTIAVSSRIGDGSVFTLQLPRLWRPGLTTALD